MKAEIRSYLAASRYVQDQLIPFYSSQAGSLVFDRTEKLVKDLLPQYVRELEGLAEGADLDFKTIMMMNMSSPPGCLDVLDKGCTTLIVPGAEGKPRLLGHTEDGPPEARGKMYIMEVEIPGTEGEEGERFTALSYPGSLAGRALGVNHLQGFVWSMNSVTPAVQAAGLREYKDTLQTLRLTFYLARQFLTRTLAGRGRFSILLTPD